MYGEVISIVYPLYPGIKLIHKKVKRGCFLANWREKSEQGFVIEHCWKGRMEYQKEDVIVHPVQGDFLIYKKDRTPCMQHYPTKDFCSMAISFDFDELSDDFLGYLHTANIDFSSLTHKYRLDACPLVKAVAGMQEIGKLTPYADCDLMVVPVTCDCKKKLASMLAETVPVHVMQVPSIRQSDELLELYVEELYRFIPVLEKVTGNRITFDALMRGVDAVGAAQVEMTRFMKLRRNYKSTLIRGTHQVDGIVYHVLRGCLVYDFEYQLIEEEMGKLDIPIIRVETDYNEEDIEQLRIRIEAFVELIKLKGEGMNG